MKQAARREFPKSASLTALSSAGNVVLAPTRTLKDWEVASDLPGRTQRFGKWQKNRSTAFVNYFEPLSSEGPMVRSPLFTTLAPLPGSASWHEERVKKVFSELAGTDGISKGEIGIDQLEASFKKLNIPIDEETFDRYACELLPAGADSVTYTDFLKFHQAVWANQPASVRRFAGDPLATGAPYVPITEGTARLKRSSSMPTGASLSELRSNEAMLRTACKRYEKSPGFVARGDIPALLTDVGLDLGIANDLGLPGSFRLNTFINGNVAKELVPLQEVIETYNKYIASLEKMRPERLTVNYVSTPKPGLYYVSPPREAALETKVVQLEKLGLLVRQGPPP